MTAGSALATLATVLAQAQTCTCSLPSTRDPPECRCSTFPVSLPRGQKRLQPGLGRARRSGDNVRVRAAGTPPLSSPGRLIGRVFFTPKLCAAQLSAGRQQADVTGRGRLCLQAQGAGRE
jgi:hypothetical protein